MKTLRKIVLFFVVALAGLLLAVVCNDRARLALFSPEGHKSSGEILGAKVGMSTSEFRSAIESRGFELWKKEKENASCPRYRIQAESIDVFFDKSWSRGIVCAGSTKGRVVIIAWYFDPLAP